MKNAANTESRQSFLNGKVGFYKYIQKLIIWDISNKRRQIR